MTYIKTKSDAGFTLLELITIVAIITTLSLIVLTNYRQGQKQFSLQRSAHKLAQDIRAAQEMAMSAKECEPCGGIIPGGYGIFIEESEYNQYIIYADTQPSPDGNQFYAPADEVIETIALETGVYIYDISTSPDKVSINFSPPDPIINIKYPTGGGGGADAPGGQVIITLALETDTSKTKSITVNKAGLIDID